MEAIYQYAWLIPHSTPLEAVAAHVVLPISVESGDEPSGGR